MPRDDLVQLCLELLAPLGAVRARRMFGDHGLYIDELFCGLIAFERLYLKVDANTKPQFAGAGCEPFVYTGKSKCVEMNYWTAPAEAMESPALMQPWARLALQAAVSARRAAPVKRKTKTLATATTGAPRPRTRAPRRARA